MDSFSNKEGVQESSWAHKRDLEHLKELQAKLKKAQAEVEAHTEQMIQKKP
jgi:hypothetical protein